MLAGELWTLQSRNVQVVVPDARRRDVQLVEHLDHVLPLGGLTQQRGVERDPAGDALAKPLDDDAGVFRETEKVVWSALADHYGWRAQAHAATRPCSLRAPLRGAGRQDGQQQAGVPVGPQQLGHKGARGGGRRAGGGRGRCVCCASGSGSGRLGAAGWCQGAQGDALT